MIKVFSKFLLSGGINFVLTYLIYLGALLIFSYRVSYSIAYFSGIVFSYFINKLFVFEANYTKKQWVLFPMIYLFQYLFGLVLGTIWVEFFLLNEKWVPIFTTVVCIPPTFILMKLLFSK